ncbi:MAG TPA: hypothetical protein VN843_10110 [Anaerolineales bacterium]|nr:hypothetical protein [Anaerolineales bacterium]
MFRDGVLSKAKESIGVGVYSMKYSEVNDFEYQVICISAEPAMNTSILDRYPE